MQITESVPGIHVIRLPLPFELNHVNVALVRLESGYLLIDTGFDTEESFRALSEAMATLGVGWSDIRKILVTHMHPDHIGMLARLRALTGAEVSMHRAEVEHLNEMVDAGVAPWLSEGLKRAGSPHSMVVAIHHSIKGLRDSLHRVTPDVTLDGGEEFATALGTARIVWTPGHTVGHVCVYWPEVGAFYSGDHMIEKITPNISWLPDRDCLAEYIASLEMLVPFEIDTVIPSHGQAFRGHAAWVLKTVAHHQERCGLLARALEAGPKTAHHLVPALWDRHLSPFHYHFALFEVLAHLEFMRRSGTVHAELTSEGVAEWSVHSPLSVLPAQV